MSNVKISELPSGTVATTDTLPVVKAGVTTKVTFGHTHPQSDVTNLVADLAAIVATITQAACRLDFTNSTTLTLSRYNGSFIPIKVSGTWTAKTIPAAGVTLANTGLTAATKYNIYAFDSSGTLTLEASTTAHAVDADTGVRIKSGDASRTLVGLAYMGAGVPGTFQAQGLGTLSWYNRQRKVSRIDVALYGSANSAGYIETSSTVRVPFVNWADDVPIGWYNASAGISGSGDQWLALWLDATTQKVEQYGGTGTTVFERTGLIASLEGITDETSHFIALMHKESNTQFFGGNQLVNKMNTVGEVCVMG